MTAGIERAVKRRFTGLLAAVPFGRLSRFGLIGALKHRDLFYPSKRTD